MDPFCVLSFQQLFKQLLSAKAVLFLKVCALKSTSTAGQLWQVCGRQIVMSLQSCFTIVFLWLDQSPAISAAHFILEILAFPSR